MLLGELGFDACLASEQPVERAVEFVLVGVLDPQLGGQGGVRPQPGGGDFGARREQALDDERRDEVALARALGGDQPLEAEFAEGSQHGFDVAVGQRTLDEEGFGSGHEGFAG